MSDTAIAIIIVLTVVVLVALTIYETERAEFTDDDTTELPTTVPQQYVVMDADKQLGQIILHRQPRLELALQYGLMSAGCVDMLRGGRRVWHGTDELIGVVPNDMQQVGSEDGGSAGKKIATVELPAKFHRPIAEAILMLLHHIDGTTRVYQKDNGDVHELMGNEGGLYLH